MFKLETANLILQELNEHQDTDLILELLNDTAFLKNIGDRGIRTKEDARNYILNGPIAMYRQHKLGMYKVSLKNGTPIGTCGLVKREELDDVDIGFAFLPAFRRQGFAFESAQAVMQYAQQELGLKRILAIALPDNQPSIRLLQKLGLNAKKNIVLPGKTETLLLMAWHDASNPNTQAEY
ncbi:GNAT family N-acetyltransferase [Microbulbifer sp. OS29]|uniref:GNAT family N-acetyltransferase n=1 Tax=Microbulbifer okhotskensis TaxID=2926617 RepID=A0A9X2EV27_9GAMM|nr:GNAT family N-acetyltransferase [Microbulbifer okhotskensis]MCO1336048.1 GNAT family N-acetyltransferase [Microbulbifer okhotskensis]